MTVQVLARVPVDDLDAAVPLYRALAEIAAGDVRRFEANGVDLAWVGPFLLLAGDRAAVAAVERTATLLVDDADAARATVVAAGGVVTEEPAPGPNGRRMIARHPDGAVFEYIEVRH